MTHDYFLSQKGYNIFLNIPIYSIFIYLPRLLLWDLAPGLPQGLLGQTPA